MLAHQWHSDSGIPVVFLHGLLGSQQDWATVLERLQIFPHIRPLTLDLCFHGESQSIACDDFHSLRSELDTTLKHVLGDHPFWLVGYSLGGRVALDFCLTQRVPHLQGVILEGANLGLQTAQEKQLRWQNDCKWAMRFEREPLENVLEDWYQQPVFADLSPCKRADLVKKRQKNQGAHIAHMLRATSLAKQFFYGEKIRHTQIPVYFLIGECDEKFRQLAEKYAVVYRLIKEAGHNTHLDNPEQFVASLVEIIK